MIETKKEIQPAQKHTALDKFERWFDIALRFGWVLFIYVVVTGNYIR
jgi:hypothetical protein